MLSPWVYLPNLCRESSHQEQSARGISLVVSFAFHIRTSERMALHRLSNVDSTCELWENLVSSRLQSFPSECAMRIAFINVRLCRSHSPFCQEASGVIRRCLTPLSRKKFWIASETNWEPLSLRREYGKPSRPKIPSSTLTIVALVTVFMTTVSKYRE